MLRLFEVDGPGRDWIESRLHDYGGPEPTPWMVVPAAIRLMDLRRGSALALAERPPTGGITNFTAVDVARSQEARSYVGKWIDEFVKRDGGHLCLLGEPFATPGETWVEKWADSGYREAMLYCDHWIVYRIVSANSCPSYNYEVIREAYQEVFCCVLASAPQAALLQVPPGSTVGRNAINEALRDVRGVAVDAYDGESFVIWTPKRISQGLENPW